MKTAFKWTAIAAAALVVVVIAALLIIPAFIDVNRYKPGLEKYVSEATGRPLSVGGDVRLSLFPWAGVSFSDLKLGVSHSTLPQTVYHPSPPVGTVNLLVLDDVLWQPPSSLVSELNVSA